MWACNKLMYTVAHPLSRKGFQHIFLAIQPAQARNNVPQMVMAACRWIFTSWACVRPDGWDAPVSSPGPSARPQPWAVGTFLAALAVSHWVVLVRTALLPWSDDLDFTHTQIRNARLERNFYWDHSTSHNKIAFSFTHTTKRYKLNQNHITHPILPT